MSYVILGVSVGFLLIMVLPDGEMALKLKSTIVSINAAVLFVIIGKFSECGVAYFVFGKKLNFSPVLWSILNRGYVVVFVIYGLINTIVIFSFSTEVWVNYHFFVSTPLFILLLMMVPSYYILASREKI